MARVTWEPLGTFPRGLVMPEGLRRWIRPLRMSPLLVRAALPLASLAVQSAVTTGVRTWSMQVSPHLLPQPRSSVLCQHKAAAEGMSAMAGVVPKVLMLTTV